MPKFLIGPCQTIVWPPNEQTVVSEVMKAGAAGFVLKRSWANDLLPAVDTIFNGHTYISHHTTWKDRGV
jgi:DNA-binding NarL/FixJ family response regulator